MKSNGFSVVREYVGHGIGTQLHEEPQVPNYVDRKNENPRLKEGMVLAVEPMVNAGRPEAVVLKDRWTAVTKDGSNCGAFRALRRGHGERAVGADAAVKELRPRLWKSGRARLYEVVLATQQTGSGPPGGRGETEFCTVGSRATGSRWS